MSGAAPGEQETSTGKLDVAVLDVAGGVERMLGEHAMFMRVLERFRIDYRHAVQPIRKALAQHDAALAQRLAHTLKGAAGMIGAERLQCEALGLERSLREHASDGAVRLEKLEQELGRLMATLDAMLANHPPPAVETALPGALTAPVEALGRLRALLDLGDGAAVELLEQERAALAAYLGAERMGALAAAVNAFAFERALALLDQDGAR
jgi:HPt (histidine-containing phosphotransfer) domain-containing protein